MSITDYKLEKRIGSGTFGEVFMGSDIHTGMKVAIKRLRKKILYENGSYLLKAYYREIEIMKKCQCQNSIRFIKEFQTQNNFNIIMELCDTDLLCYLYQRPKPFSSEEIKECFLQLNNAFKKMNENNIIHRDLKLGNVLIKFIDESKKKFIPKLTDYGFSKELTMYNFNQNTHLGTPATMAPEVMMNIKCNSDKIDLWSIGVMMYQLYYREVPYDGNTEEEILRKINANLPYKQPEDPKLRDLINRLLVVNVEKRISWIDYFNHPFFTGENLNYNERNIFNLSYSFSLKNNPGEKKRNDKDYGYSFNAVTAGNNFLVQGDIYGKTEIKSTKNLLNVNEILGEDDNINSKIKLLSKGRKMKDNEYYSIISACIECYDKKLIPLPEQCIKKIKDMIKGEWFVFIYSQKENNFDYYLSLDNEKYLSFEYKGNIFEISRI
jgi:serine/threonine protein kinase